MPREKKPIEVDVIKDAESGESISIGYDPNPGRNYHVAHYGDDSFRDQDAEKVRAWARMILAEARTVTWQPVIEVRRLTGADYIGDKVIGLAVERYYLAKRVDGKWIKTSWTPIGSEGKRYSQAAQLPDKFEIGGPPQRGSFGKHEVHHLHYTPELWASLDRLVDGIKAARAQLAELLGTEAGQLRLQDVGAALLLALPAPAPSEETPR